MHWEQIQQNWPHFRALAKEKWPKLTDADLDRIGGDQGKLAQKLEQAYGFSAKEVEAELKEFSLDAKH